MTKISEQAFDDGALFDELASAPTTPPAGLWRAYFKSDGMYIVDDAGVETGPFGTGGAGLGAWTTDTPTWATTGTAPALGNGTLTARYKLLDSKTCLYYLTFIAGSTTTYGTGTWSFTLPVTARTGNEQILTGHILDSGTDSKLAVGRIASGGTTVYQVVPEGGNAVNNGVPQTWATGDRLELSGIIEVA